MCMWSIGSVARFSVNSHDLGILAEIVVAMTMAIQIHSALDPVHFAQNTATICTTIRAPDNYSLPRAIYACIEIQRKRGTAMARKRREIFD